MKDRHRFRVWSPEKGRYLNITDMYHGPEIYVGKNFFGIQIEISPNQNTDFEPDFNAIIEWCTGIQDCKNQLIYEGDIVKVKVIGGTIFPGGGEPPPEGTEVQWIELSEEVKSWYYWPMGLILRAFDCWVIEPQREDEGTDIYYPDGPNFSWGDVEVVGNIHTRQCYERVRRRKKK